MWSQGPCDPPQARPTSWGVGGGCPEWRPVPRHESPLEVQTEAGNRPHSGVQKLSESPWGERLGSRGVLLCSDRAEASRCICDSVQEGVNRGAGRRGRAGRGGEGEGKGGRGLCGRARALLTQRRSPRSPVEGSRWPPWGWGVGRVEGRRHFRALLPEVDGPGGGGSISAATGGRLWAGRLSPSGAGTRRPPRHASHALPAPGPRSPGCWPEGSGRLG